jgi:hypothetical protein
MDRKKHHHGERPANPHPQIDPGRQSFRDFHLKLDPLGVIPGLYLDLEIPPAGLG